MSFQLPSLPDNVSRNAHLLYSAQSSRDTILRVDSKGNLQRVGFFGKIATKIVDAFTDKFTLHREAKVEYISRKTLNELNNHIEQVKKLIDEKKPDLQKEEVKKEIRKAIYINPPRHDFKVEKVLQEPVYLVDPEELHQIQHLEQYGENPRTGSLNSSIVEAYDAMGEKYGEVEYRNVSRSRIFLGATDLARRVNDTITLLSSPEAYNRPGDANWMRSDNELQIQARTSEAESVIKEHEAYQQK